MENPESDLYTSILLVNNIHCPSCVSYAEDILRPLTDIVQVAISIISQEIRLHHRCTKTAYAAIQELEKGAFEIQHIKTFDGEGRTIRDREISGTRIKQSPFHSWPLFVSKTQRKHIENCNACRAERANQSMKSKVWAASRTRGILADVEKQALSKALVDGAAPIEVSDLNNVDAEQSHGQEFAEYIVSLGVEGMTCASCSGSISNKLEALDFVTDVNINLLTNSGKVTYHGPKENSDKIVSCIQDAGYEASVVEIKPYYMANSSKLVPYKFVASLSLEGMTCGSCVGTITEGLETLSFVHEINIDLVGNSGKITFEGRQNIDKILQKIDDLGYDAAVVELKGCGILQPTNEAVSDRTVTIAVEGMYCEHCPEDIIGALKDAFVDAIVIEKSLNLQDPKIRIRYTPSPPQLTIRKIMNTISSTNEAFSAQIWHPPTIEELSRAMQRHEQRRILFRLVFTFLVAIPSLVIGVIYMSLVSKSDPNKMWFEEPVWVGNVSRTEWALFIMTTPVMFFGADYFHTRAIKEIRAVWRPGSTVPILRRFYRFGSMNLLISAGTFVAYFSSVAVLILDARTPPQHAMGGQSSTYFDSVTFLSFFILIGKYLEAYSKAKTGDAVAMLGKLRPDEAILLEPAPNGRSELETPRSEASQHVQVDMLEVGDNVRVVHGASPPTDGIVSSDGTFLFDESSLTGESKPVKKVAGDQVFTGSVNISQPVDITVTGTGGSSMLDKIVALVREGQSKRAPIERIADTITGYFVPVITLIAVVTFIVWLALGMSGALPARYLTNAQGGWPFWSLEFAIAVFVVACPCGLGLAAPTALFVGGGLAAKHGILVRGGGEAFQEASRLDAIVFDKTGTLTEGQMKVTDYEMLGGGHGKVKEQALVFALSRALEDSSTHPIAKAIAAYCTGEDIKNVDIMGCDITEIPGQGMRGRFTVWEPNHQDMTVYSAAIGNQKLLSSLQDDNERGENYNMYLEAVLNKFQSRGQSTAIFYLRQAPTNNKSFSTSFPPSFQPIAVFAISDPIRPSAQSVLSTLRRHHNLQVHMCTGDNPRTALAIASQLGIPPASVRAGVMPIDKAAYIKELQQQPLEATITKNKEKREGRKIVAFIGDGTNDTPALTASDVSIALSSGSDIAISTSSFILLNNDLNTLLTLVSLSKRVFSRVKWNFVWAAMYNVLLVPVAAGAFFRLGDLNGKEGMGWKLGPVWASAAMALSSVSVVVSSLALRLPPVGEWWSKKRTGPRNEGKN